MSTAGDDIAHEQAQEYEALLQFLYMAPVGLVQLAADGAIPVSYTHLTLPTKA